MYPPLDPSPKRIPGGKLQEDLPRPSLGDRASGKLGFIPVDHAYAKNAATLTFYT